MKFARQQGGAVMMLQVEQYMAANQRGGQGGSGWRVGVHFHFDCQNFILMWG